jgi:hypothetical protein
LVQDDWSTVGDLSFCDDGSDLGNVTIHVSHRL